MGNRYPGKRPIGVNGGGYDVIIQWAAGEPLWQIQGGNAYRYAQDSMRNVVGLLNSSNTLVANYIYDAWGSEASTSFDNLTLKNPLRYRGAEGYLQLYGRDACRGWSLYLAGARVYHTGVGRWLQEDPLRGNLGDPMSFNRYLYVNANPVDYSDPSGMQLYVRPHCPDMRRNGKYLQEVTSRMGGAVAALLLTRSAVGAAIGGSFIDLGNPVHGFLAPYVRRACWGEYLNRLDGTWQEGPESYPFGWDKGWEDEEWGL